MWQGWPPETVDRMTLRQIEFWAGKVNERLAIMYGGKGGKGRTGHPLE